jgi:putative glycosyltransferase (TIGR04372 family)
MLRYAKLILIMPFGFLVLLLLIILRPFVVVRLMPIRSTSIGHFVGNTAMYFCERDAGLHPKGTYDILYYNSSFVTNNHLKVMWERIFKEYKLIVIPGFFSGVFNRIELLLSSYRPLTCHFVATIDKSPAFLKKGRVHLAFTEEEEKRGKAELKGFGLPDNAEFICIYSRDTEYLNSIYPEVDFSFTDFRNSDISNFLPTAVEMTKRGYYVFRMGAMGKPLPELNNPMIIDFPFSGRRNDFLDIYIWARCKFCVATISGPAAIPIYMRKPAVLVNWIPISLMEIYNSNMLFLPKPLYMKRFNRYSTFVEQNLFEAYCRGSYSRVGYMYSDAGFEVRENSAQEILDIAIEMDERLKGTYVANGEEERLQAQFWRDVFPSLDPSLPTERRIGAKFLRDNRHRIV